MRFFTGKGKVLRISLAHDLKMRMSVGAASCVKLWVRAVGSRSLFAKFKCYREYGKVKIPKKKQDFIFFDFF